MTSLSQVTFITANPHQIWALLIAAPPFSHSDIHNYTYPIHPRHYKFFGSTPSGADMGLGTHRAANLINALV